MQSVFEFPLRYFADLRTWVIDTEGRHCLDFSHSLSDSQIDLMLGCINGTMTFKNDELSFYYDDTTGKIRNHANATIITVRGWGYLSSTFGEDAGKIQDEFAQEIVRRLNDAVKTDTM